MLIVIFPIILSFIFLIFSYLWIDHGFVTFLANSHQIINNLFEVIKFANENRIILAKIYLALLAILFLFQFALFIPRIYKKIKIKTFFIVAGITSFIYAFSFPFLSRDIFSYYFYAKMALFYKVNPFVIAPIDFMEKDLFVGLLHNIASPYLYGRGFLLYTIILMVITTFNKVVTYFILYRFLNWIYFFLGGLIIYKLIKDKRIFAIWFFNPYILIEWLMNGHNDTMMAFFFIVAVYFLYSKKWIQAGISYLFSILVKFVSVLAIPVVFLNKKWQEIYFKFAGLLLPLLLHLQNRTIEPWYYLWSFMFLPFANLKTLSWVMFSLIGLISAVNYFGFIESSGWGMSDMIPHSLEITFILITTILLYEYWEFILHKAVEIRHFLGSK